MNRRHFIKISGISFAGLISNVPAFANIPPGHLLALPGKVFIQSSEELFELTSSDKSKWIFKDVEVVVHPQSTVHAMVEYNDGSVIAQVSATDMRMPIQYALTYPHRASAPVPKLDWALSRVWEFEAPDLDKFRLLKLAYQSQETGGSATCTLNAADEIAVEAFLEERISFPGIAEVVEDTLNRVPVRNPDSVGGVLEIDRESREMARVAVRERSLAGNRK